MKAYILSEEDLERLRLMICRDPKYGYNGGSSQADVRDPENEKAHDAAHRFYNYQVCKWIDEVKK